MTETTPDETLEEATEVLIEKEQVVLETLECDCDVSTRQSGFCPHGNNV